MTYQLKGKEPVHRSLSPDERLPWHCSEVEVEHWHRIACPADAVDLYEVEPGYKVGYCEKHRDAGSKHAQRLGWQRLEVAA